MTNQTSPERRWRKSSYSGSGNNCVEVATAGAQVAVRDSKNPGGPEVACTRAAWRDLLTAIKSGEFRLG